MGNGRQRVLQPRSALARGAETTEKHPHGRNDLCCLIDPTTSGALEANEPEGLGFKGCGLLTEGVQQSDAGEAGGMERGRRGPAMHTPPLAKRPEERGLGWGWEHHGSGRHQPQGCKEGDKMAGPQNHGTRAPARITSGLSALKGIGELRQRFRLALLDAEPVLLGPWREAVYATNEAQDTAWLRPTRFEPKTAGLEMGTCGARALSLSGEGPFYIGVQQAALLHGRP
jgi:hypothetical protein